MDRLLQRVWYESSPRWLLILLTPLSWLFGWVAGLRRGAYRRGWLRTERVGRPVIVIGNITVGGTGKTPFTIWLARQLQAQGIRVGIVLRGYGGRATRSPREVGPQTPWEEVGDEAVLLATLAGCIVVAGPDRVAAARRAIELDAQVVLSDDGLQHYRLGRDCEIAVLDSRRRFGNGRLLPAGPLREAPGRLQSVDLIVVSQRDNDAKPTVDFTRGIDRQYVVARGRLNRVEALVGGHVRTLESFRGMRVHAVAGIGHPQAFFDALAAAGLRVETHPFADHAVLTRADITFGDDAPVLMTQKDAVRCRELFAARDNPAADTRHWAVSFDLDLSAEDAAIVKGIVATALRRFASSG